MNQARSGHGCAIIKVNLVPHLIVAGGFSVGVQEMPRIMNTVEILSLAGDGEKGFRLLAPMKKARYGFALVANTDHSVLAIGGLGNSNFLWIEKKQRYLKPNADKYT